MKDIQRSALRLPGSGRVSSGYLILTSERLLFHDKSPQTEWVVIASGRKWLGVDPAVEYAMLEYELLAIDRNSIISVEQTNDEDGKTWLEIRFPPAADGSAANEGEASVLVRGNPHVWLTALSPSP